MLDDGRGSLRYVPHPRPPGRCHRVGSVRPAWRGVRWRRFRVAPDTKTRTAWRAGPALRAQGASPRRSVRTTHPSLHGARHDRCACRGNSGRDPAIVTRMVADGPRGHSGGSTASGPVSYRDAFGPPRAEPGGRALALPHRAVPAGTRRGARSSAPCPPPSWMPARSICERRRFPGRNLTSRQGARATPAWAASGSRASQQKTRRRPAGDGRERAAFPLDDQTPREATGDGLAAAARAGARWTGSGVRFNSTRRL
jgi:hypothetical protein